MTELAGALRELSPGARAFIFRDWALRFWQSAQGEQGARRSFEAVERYPLPKPASLGGGPFEADIAIRDVRSNHTVAVVFVAMPGEDPEGRAARLEPYLRFSEASQMLQGSGCHLILFVPAEEVAAEDWKTPGPTKTVFSY